MEAGTPERLTTESGVYTGLNYSSDGTHLYAIRRPLHALRRGAASNTNSVGTDDVLTAETVWLPAAGGPVRNWTGTYWKEPMGGTLSSLHVLPGKSERIARFVAGEGRGLISGKPRDAGVILTNARDKAADTALKIVFPALRAYPWIFMDGRSLADAVLSPTGDRALVVQRTNILYLVDVPAKKEKQPPTVTFDPNAPGVYRVTPLTSGAEFPQWRPDGRAFTYSLGNTFYTVTVPEKGAPSAPKALVLDVTQPRDLPTGTLALRNARLITMRGNEVIERGDLVIRDRRIAAVGPAGTVAIPANAHTVDVSGKTIIPGLVDGHNHIFPPPAITRSRLWIFEANLGYGLLNSRDVQATNTATMSYEDLLATGELLGPRYMNTGPGIGPVSNGDVIASLEDARQVVARYADVYKVRHVKEYDLTRRDARQWLIMAAAERQMNVVSHGGRQLRHMLQNAIDGYGGYDHLWFAGPLYRDVRQLVAVTGLTLGNILWNQDDNMGKSVPDEWRMKWNRLYPPDFVTGNRFLPAPGEEPGQPRNRVIETSLAQIALEGGRVMASGHGNTPGLMTHFEMWGLSDGGLPAMNALRAGTLHGAEALGMDRDIGSLEVGKLGDVLILDRNPLDDIRNTNSIRAIVFNGRLRDALTLDELWPRQRPTPPMWWVP